MMGDRDFRSTIQSALASIGKELEIDIDSKDIQTIHLQEVVQCLRRSYFDRIEPEETERRGFNELLSGLLRKLQYGSEPRDFEIDGIKLKGQVDMLVDDSIMLFRSALDELEKVTNGKLSPEEKTDLKLNVVGKIPEILLDNTDRNRTSPFAFTGNKFEFRAVGSTANCATPMTVLNSIVAKQLIEFKKSVDFLIDEKKMKKDDAIFNVLREYVKDSKRIRFEGDGYGKAWEVEAKKRGLSNHRSTPEALKAKVAEKTIALYEELNIMSRVEIEARYEIKVEEYSMRIQIEGRVLGDIARNHVIPTAIKYQNILIKNVQGLKNIYGSDFKRLSVEQLKLIEKISEHIGKINMGITDMIEERKKANKINSTEKCAEAYCNKVKPYFDQIRYHCDKLELLVDDELWPLSKYREMLMFK